MNANKTTCAKHPMCWQPSVQRQMSSQLWQFMRFAEQRFALAFPTYAALHAWSIANLADFWQAVWDFSPLTSETPLGDIFIPAPDFMGSRWFTGATFNFAEQLLNTRNATPAIIFRDESGRREVLSYQALYSRVAACQAGLLRLGVGPGDCVAGMLPNIPETVIAMLATTATGAIWSSCSPDFGEQAVCERFGQIQPKVIFTTDSAVYAGKPVATLSKARAIATHCSDAQWVVIAHHNPDARTDFGIDYRDFIDSFAQDCRFERFAFDHPIAILYSSGTTGHPKAITHGAGGTLLQHYKELALHTDITLGDVVFYYTTCGWMMWNWLTSSLLLGATIVLYDGSPLHPTIDVLLDAIDDEGINVFGASAKYYASLQKKGCRPNQRHALTSLTTLLSTGSPLLPEQYDYLYSTVKPNMMLASISGGTDLISCFALGCPIKPVYRGQAQCIGLGMDVAIVDDQGHAITAQKGELVCRQPFPSRPLYFWGDVGNQRYRQAYFEQFPGVWTHGDYAQITGNGGVVFYGRSDATLNPGGIRIGTAEIYHVVESDADIRECCCVGWQVRGDERLILLVVMQPHTPLTDNIRARLRLAIREQLSAHFVPHNIIALSALPRTLSGKVVELAVKAAVNGEPIDNSNAIANPEVLDEIANWNQHPE